MPSRSIHSRDGGVKVRNLLGSFFSTLLLDTNLARPVYLISPWLSDFQLLDNKFSQFTDLFSNRSEYADNLYILFSEILIEISYLKPIRIITWPDANSKAFAKKFEGIGHINVLFEKYEIDHQKGLLTDSFYFEGSMNFTYSGVYKNKEKVTCSSSYYADGSDNINEAYLEFERIWENLISTSD